MSGDALIDTGAILALLDRSDRWHGVCVEVFRQLRLPLLTSEAVLTELFHLVGDSRAEMEAAWRFVESGAVALAAIEGSELPQIHALMSRYWDRPMDYADATLVHLAKRESLSTILTVDHADFDTYRIEGRRRFRVLPANRP
jgi:predicted nucleic acid-binding protein